MRLECRDAIRSPFGFRLYFNGIEAAKQKDRAEMLAALKTMGI